MFSKITTNMALRRGIALVTDEWATDSLGRPIDRFYVTGIDDDGEPWDEFLASYQHNFAVDDASYTYCGGCWGVEDLPAWIESEKKLRAMLDTFAAEIDRFR